jgi:hypothetical protein
MGLTVRSVTSGVGGIGVGVGSSADVGAGLGDSIGHVDPSGDLTGAVGRPGVEPGSAVTGVDAVGRGRATRRRDAIRTDIRAAPTR